MSVSSAQAAELFVRRAPGLFAPLGSVLAVEHENHEVGEVPPICNGGAGGRGGWGHEGGDADNLVWSHHDRAVLGTTAGAPEQQCAESAPLEVQPGPEKTSDSRYQGQASVTLACKALIRRYSAAVASALAADDLARYEAEECGWDDGESVLLMWIERRLLEKGTTRSMAYDDFRFTYSLQTSSDKVPPTVSGALGSCRSSTKRLSGSSFFSDLSFSKDKVSSPVSTGSRGTGCENSKPAENDGAESAPARMDYTCTMNSAVVTDSLPSRVLNKTRPRPKETDSILTRWVHRGRSLTDEGRLEGWKEEQLVVRAVVRPKQILSQLRSGVRRMSKKVTFSLDHQEANCARRDGGLKSPARRGSQRRHSLDSPSSRRHLLTNSASGDAEPYGPSDPREREKFPSLFAPSRRPSEKKATHRTNRRGSGAPGNLADPAERRNRRAHSVSSGSRRRNLLSPLPLLLELLDDDEPLLSGIILEPKPDYNSGTSGARQHASGLLSGGSGTGLGGGGGLLLTHYSPGFPSGVHRQYHPSDRPEVLFPQARARHLRRHFERQGSAAFTSTCSLPSGEDERSRASSGAVASRPSRSSSPPEETPLSSFSLASSTGSARRRSNSKGGLQDSGPAGLGSDSERVTCDTPQKPLDTRPVGTRGKACGGAAREAPAEDDQGKRPRFRGRLSRFLSHWKLPPVTSAAADWYPAPAPGEQRIDVNKILMATSRDTRDLPLFPFSTISDQSVCGQGSDGRIELCPASSASGELAGNHRSQDAGLSTRRTSAVAPPSWNGDKAAEEQSPDAFTSNAVALLVEEARKASPSSSDSAISAEVLEALRGCQERKRRLTEEESPQHCQESESHHRASADAKSAHAGETVAADDASDKTFSELAKDKKGHLRQKVSAGRKLGFARRLANLLRRGESKSGVK